VTRTLRDAIDRFDLRCDDFLAIIDGIKMDASADIRAPSQEQLDLYCEQTAVAVGRIALRIFGAAPPDGERLAAALGRGMSLIGVEALHRNSGCGAALLQHRLRQCDREHLPAYLWSSNPLNISLYERHGFEIAGTIQVGSSPPIFPMLRHAR
jgi:GNAT superfamily N-acetyltransferase